MVRFFDPKKTKEESERALQKKGGGFGIMDLAEIAAPIAGMAFGGPLGAMAAGAAVTAIKGGVEGKGVGDIFKDVAIGGGIDALTMGAGGGFKGAGKAAAKGVTKEVATKTLGKGMVEQAVDQGAKNALGLGLGQATNRGLAGLKGGIGAGLDMGVSGGAPITEAVTTSLKSAAAPVTQTAKQRFLDEAGNLATMGLNTYSQVQAESEQKRRFAEAQSMQFMQNLQNASMGGGFTPPSSRFYQPYGGV